MNNTISQTTKISYSAHVQRSWPQDDRISSFHHTSRMNLKVSNEKLQQEKKKKEKKETQTNYFLTIIPSELRYKQESTANLKMIF
jgi:hypothetical protein